MVSAWRANTNDTLPADTTDVLCSSDPKSATCGNSHSFSFPSDYLPAPEICLQISIQIVCHLTLAEMRSLSGEEESLHEFLLSQIVSLHEVVAPFYIVEHPQLVKDLFSQQLDRYCSTHGRWCSTHGHIHLCPPTNCVELQIGRYPKQGC
jgi:hypothetical protein